MTAKSKIAKQYTVQCAQCEYWEYLEDATTELDEAIVIAADQGWERVDGLWLCIDCQNKGESK